MNNSEIFFNRVIEYGSIHYDHFTRFKKYPDNDKLEYRNLVRGVCCVLLLEKEGVSLNLEARMPKKVSTKTLQKLFKKHSQIISENVGSEMIWTESNSNSEPSKVTIFHEFPEKRTDLTFINYVKLLTSSMNEMILAVISV